MVWKNRIKMKVNFMKNLKVFWKKWLKSIQKLKIESLFLKIFKSIKKDLKFWKLKLKNLKKSRSEKALIKDTRKD